jgi:hypothetical protein
MDDVASLGFSVDAKPLLEAAIAADKLTESARAVEAQTTKVGNAQALAATRSDRLTREHMVATRAAHAAVVANSELSDRVDLISRATEEAYRSLSTRSYFRLLAREASMAGGPLGQMIGHFGILTVGGQRLGIVTTSAVIGIAAMTAAVVKLVAAFAELEQTQSRTGNLLQLTNGASGQTVAGLENSARTMAQTGLVSLTDIRAAQQELLKFRNVGADAFDKVLEAAMRLSGTGLTDMKTATKAIAEALKDQGNASQALADVGLKLSVSQQMQIDAFLRAGKVLDANRLILDAIAMQTKNLDKGSDDLSTSWGKLTTSLGDSVAMAGKWLTEATNTKGALDTIGSMLKRNAELWRQQGKPGGGTGGFTARPGEEQASFNDRFDSAGIKEFSQNVEKLKKAMDEAKKAIEDQARTAGMSAVQVEMYNQTVARGIPANSQAAAAIRRMVQSTASINETRTVTDQIKEQTLAFRIEAQTVNMLTGPAAEYRAVQEAIGRAKLKNIELSQSQIEAIKKEAAAMGEAARAAERMRDINNAVGSFVSGLVTDLSHGVKATEALRNALTRLADMLIDMAARRLVAQALGGLFGAPTPVAHGGGTLGYDSFPMRNTSWSLFHGAPKFHSGGTAGREIPAILQEGESVLTPGQMRSLGKMSGGSSGPITVNVNNAPAGTKATATTSKDRGGGPKIDIWLETQIGDTAASLVDSGQSPLNASLERRYGLAPKI